MTAIEKQIAHLVRDIEHRRQRLRDLEQKHKNAARTEETRRKIIIGAAVLTGLRTRSPEAQEKTLEWVYRHVTNKRDREFLGLPPLQAPKGDK